MSVKKLTSQTRTRAGRGAEFLSVFAIVWNTVVCGLLLPKAGLPFWFKAIFLVASLLVTWATFHAWWQRIKGGRVSLDLSHDPVPHGVPVLVGFNLGKTIHADKWCVEAKIQSKSRNQSNFGLVWSQDFPAQLLGEHRVSAQFTLPSDYPSTAASDGKTDYQVTLVLKADSLTWDFDLQTRAATASDSLFNIQNTKNIGSNLPQYSPEQITKIRSRWTKFAVVFGLSILAIQISSFFDLNLWSQARAKVGAGAYSTSIVTEEFDIRVTNLLISDWALRGRLIGRARVAHGELTVRVTELRIQPTGACTAEGKSCEVESVRLLLIQDGDKNFSTIAQTEPIPVNTNLRNTTRWSLPAEQQEIEIHMRLPAAIDINTMRFKLEIRSVSGSTVYPDHGPYLALHRALAKAHQQKEPCSHLSSKIEFVRAGCSEELQKALYASDGLLRSASTHINNVWQDIRGVAVRVGIGSAPAQAKETLENLLLEALRTENFDAAYTLLAMGANPNVENPDDAGRTALGYAAAANDLAMVERLLQVGAFPDLRKSNDSGQIVTPVTQALRTDAVAAIKVLLKAGASLQTNDPKGWTPMHIAAYESASLTLPELVRAGADINEKTTAYRQQTVLQTALQNGDIQTVRTLLNLGADPQLKDNQGENSCGWARFFKRNQEIQDLVCPVNPATLVQPINRN
jgi:hypothetical protein